MDRAYEQMRDGVVLLESTNNGIRAEFKYRSKATGNTRTAAVIKTDGKWEFSDFESSDELLEEVNDQLGK
jgi:hypothetical protein